MESFSASLSSGPISAIGSLLAYFFTDNLVIIRTSNFIYNLLILNVICYFISKSYKLSFFNLAIISNFTLITIPWWFGSLYSLGEVPSVLLFTCSIFIYNINRNVSLFLMGLSIIFGKIFLLSIFIPLILILLFVDKQIKITNILFAILPYIFFGALIQINSDINFFQYTQKVFNLIISHPSSGIDPILLDENILQRSELKDWSMASFGRALVAPLFFLIFIRIFITSIEDYFNLNYTIIFIVITIPYIWFWLLNDTKWIRYTQFFIIPLLFMLNTFLIKFGYKDKKFISFYLLTLSFFFSSNLIFIAGVLLSFLNYFYDFRKIKINNYVIILIIFILNSLNYFYEVNRYDKMNINFKPCSVEIDSYECFKNYEGNI